MKYWIAVLIIIFISLPFDLLSQNISAEGYYKKIKDTGFFHEKIEMGKSIGRLQTDTAKAGLILALKDDSYWDRTAAVWGLVQFNDPAVTQMLVNAMFDDHMISSDAENALSQYAPLHIETIKTLFDSEAKSENRRKLLQIIASSKTQSGEQFLKKQIDGRNEFRLEALKSLSENYPKNNYQYIKSFLEDEPAQSIVLKHMVTYGDKTELPVMNRIIEENKRVESMIVAYSGIAQWGDPALAARRYHEALNSENPSLQQGALYTFQKIKSDRIRNDLCRLTRQGKLQSIRIGSALQLTSYNDKAAIPYLISTLKEEYASSEDNESFLLKGFVAVVSLGIIPFLQDVSKRNDRSSFYSDLGTISNALSKLTGQKFGPSYIEWKDWAIDNGYGIDGENIIQHLYSGYAATREAARSAAVRLLGYKDIGQYMLKNPSFKNKTDLEKSSEIAQLMIKEGMLVDEKY